MHNLHLCDWLIVEGDPGVPAGQAGDPLAGLDGVLRQQVAALMEGKEIGTALMRANVGARDAALRRQYGSVTGATQQRRAMRLAAKNVQRSLSPILDEAARTLGGLMNEWLAGDITYNEMRLRSSTELRQFYERVREVGRNAAGLERMGVSDRLHREEETWFRSAVREELRYWHTFLHEINEGRVNPDRVAERLGMYVRALRFMFEAARVQALPDNVLLHWIGPKKDDPNICEGCVQMMEWSPFPKELIPAVPRDGSTPCLTNCRHKVVVRVATQYNDVIRRKNQLERIVESRKPRKAMVRKLKDIKESRVGRRRTVRAGGRASNPFRGDPLPKTPTYRGRLGRMRMEARERARAMLDEGLGRASLTEALRPVDVREVVAHLRRIDAQYPMPDEAEEFTWSKGRVPLRDIQLSPSPRLSYRASDPNVLSKVRKTFESPEDSIAQARAYAERGGRMPAVVLGGGAPYDVMDGFHRVLAAALRGDAAIDAYVAGDLVEAARRVRPPRPFSVDLPPDSEIEVAWAIGPRAGELKNRRLRGRALLRVPIDKLFNAVERWQRIDLNNPRQKRVWQARWWWSLGNAMDPSEVGIADQSGQIVFDDGRHRLAAAWQLGERYGYVYAPPEDVDEILRLVPGAQVVRGGVGEGKEDPPDETGRETCGIFLRVPEPLASQFPGLGDEDKSPPHATMLYVGKVTPEEYQTVVEVAQAVCSRLQPFVVEMTDYGEFQNPSGQTIAHMVPRVLNGPELALIHEALYAEALRRGLTPAHIRSGAFKPHVTLAYMDPDKAYDGPRPAGAFRVGALEVWGSGVWFEGVLGNTRVPLGGGRPVAVDEARVKGTPYRSFDAAPYATMDLRDVARLLLRAARARDKESLIPILDRLLAALEHTTIAIEGRPRGHQVAQMFRQAFVELADAMEELPEAVAVKALRAQHLLECRFQPA